MLSLCEQIGSSRLGAVQCWLVKTHMAEPTVQTTTENLSIFCASLRSLAVDIDPLICVLPLMVYP